MWQNKMESGKVAFRPSSARSDFKYVAAVTFVCGVCLCLVLNFFVLPKAFPEYFCPSEIINHEPVTVPVADLIRYTRILNTNTTGEWSTVFKEVRIPTYNKASMNISLVKGGHIEWKLLGNPGRQSRKTPIKKPRLIGSGILGGTFDDHFQLKLSIDDQYFKSFDFVARNLQSAGHPIIQLVIDPVARPSITENLLRSTLSRDKPREFVLGPSTYHDFWIVMPILQDLTFSNTNAKTVIKQEILSRGPFGERVLKKVDIPHPPHPNVPALPTPFIYNDFRDRWAYDISKEPNFTNFVLRFRLECEEDAEQSVHGFFGFKSISPIFMDRNA